jgi:hypothetical protein
MDKELLLKHCMAYPWFLIMVTSVRYAKATEEENWQMGSINFSKALTLTSECQQQRSETLTSCSMRARAESESGIAITSRGHRESRFDGVLPRSLF